MCKTILFPWVREEIDLRRFFSLNFISILLEYFQDKNQSIYQNYLQVRAET